VTLTENVGRCPRCGKFIVEEQWEVHQCDFRDIEFNSAKEVLVDRMSDSGQNRNGDHVHLAWGLDGIFYRLVECKHNPPHRSTKRKFADPPPDKLPVYLEGG
jgi:hypothetical protein